MKNKQNLPFGPVGLPFLGNVLRFRYKQLGFLPLISLHSKYGLRVQLEPAPAAVRKGRAYEFLKRRSICGDA